MSGFRQTFRAIVDDFIAVCSICQARIELIEPSAHTAEIILHQLRSSRLIDHDVDIAHTAMDQVPSDCFGKFQNPVEVWNNQLLPAEIDAVDLRNFSAVLVRRVGVEPPSRQNADGNSAGMAVINKRTCMTEAHDHAWNNNFLTADGAVDEQTNGIYGSWAQATHEEGRSLR
mgnify:FL=1